jgi:adenosine kinase
MRTLICGSVAYDNIMIFEGRFRDHILDHQIHILNVSFLVPEMRRDYGGCAANIAYSLKGLGGDPQIMATVGQDASPYLERLSGLGISTACIRQIEDTFTAQAFITTDQDNNQISAFHPGAMSFSQRNRVSDAGPIELGIIAPDGREGMLEHARQMAEAGIPFIFDPGQGLPMFSGAELTDLIDLARYVAVNDYEALMLVQRTGRSLDSIAAQGKTVIVTKGAEGSIIYDEARVIDIEAVSAQAVVDPTGCGDAYRSGLLFGISNRLDWATTGRLASVMGALKIAHRGPQNHSISKDLVADRFFEAFAYRPW